MTETPPDTDAFIASVAQIGCDQSARVRLDPHAPCASKRITAISGKVEPEAGVDRNQLHTRLMGMYSHQSPCKRLQDHNGDEAKTRDKTE